MKHLVLLITIVLALTSCAKPHWVQTNNGKYIYGIFMVYLMTRII